MAKKPTDYSDAVSGNEGKPTKMRDVPPRLPALQKHMHGMPPPVRVKVKDGMGTKPAASPAPDLNQPVTTGGTRKRHRSR